MARLRFPGRPGYRFGRCGIRYGQHEPKDFLDSSTRIIVNVHKGLKYFHEVFGESDEDGFDGFSELEVNQVTSRLLEIDAHLAELRKQIKPVKQNDALQFLEKESKRKLRQGNRDLCKTIIKEGMGQPMKCNINAKLFSLSRAGKIPKVKDRGKIEKHSVKEKKIRMTFPGLKVKLDLEKAKSKKYLAKLKRIDRGNNTSERIELDVDDDNIKYDLPKLKVRGRPKKKKDLKEEVNLKGKSEHLRKVIVVPKTKKVDTTFAQQLLAKARKGQKKNGDSAGRKVIKAHSNIPRQFILPVVSSRSSRKIIPNKKFLENTVQAGFGVHPSAEFRPSNTTVTKQKEKYSPNIIPTKSAVLNLKKRKTWIKHKATSAISGIVQVTKNKKITPRIKITTSLQKSKKKFTTKKVAPIISPSLKQSHQMKDKKSKRNPKDSSKQQNNKLMVSSPSFYDQPVVVLGKRDRKPSSKLLDKWNDEDVDVDHAFANISPRKITSNSGPNLCQRSLASNRPEKQQVDIHARATKRSGKNILHKAKLRLNQVTLNKSKIALAKSLKKQMKKDQVPSKQRSPTFLPLKPVNVTVSPLKMGTHCTDISPKFGAISMPQGPKKGSGDVETLTAFVGEKIKADPKNFCIVCGDRTSLHKFKGKVTCWDCQRFYKIRVRLMIERGSEFTCEKDGKCNIFMKDPKKISMKTKKGTLCTGCRFKKCAQMFPSPEKLYNELYADTSIQRGYTKVPIEPCNMDVLQTEKEECIPRYCAVCGNNIDKTCKNTQVCRGCTRWYRRYLRFLYDKQKMYLCDKEGNCDLNILKQNEKTASKLCKGCRFRQCAIMLPLPNRAALEQQDCAPVIGSEATLVNVQKVEEEILARKKAAQESEGSTSCEQVTASNVSTVFGRLSTLNTETLKIATKPQSDTNILALELVEELPQEEFKGSSVEHKTNTTQVEPGQLIAEGSVEEAPSDIESGHVRCPRVKHVCRRAAIAFGQPTATFPFTLSALPSPEKEKILAVEAEMLQDDSDSNISLEEIISRAQQKEDSSVNINNTEGKPHTVMKRPSRISPKSTWRKFGEDFEEDFTEGYTPQKKKFKEFIDVFKTKTGKLRVRRMRCKECPGCIAQDCRECVFCHDMLKYGGTGKMKQCCIHRRCTNPVYPGLKPGEERKRRTPRSPKKIREKKTTPNKTPSPASKAHTRKDSGIIKAKMLTFDPSHVRNDSTADEDLQEGATKQTGTDSVPLKDVLSKSNILSKSALIGSKPALLGLSKNITKDKKLAMQPKLPKSDVHNSKSGRIATKIPNLSPNKRKFRDPSRPKPKYPSNPDNHLLKMDYKVTYDINNIYQEGIALLSTVPFCTRIVCYLCGSAGKHKLLYCAVCCEPYHSFCLQTHERPHENNLENWCCPGCYFCHVCGKQQNLLSCTKCGDTYHPNCLGSNYPTKPTKRKIWLCTRCVKCKSCGRTTPGDKASDVWTHDFSLCHECGRNKEQGNFCPVCHQCYSIDDWESKMIQCVKCDSWVHSKCEKLTDEMYEIFSLLPEDIPFVCQVCAPNQIAPHKQVIEEDMKSGFIRVLESLLSARSTDYIAPIVEESEVPTCVPASNDTTSIQSSASNLVSLTSSSFSVNSAKPNISLSLLPKELRRTLSSETGSVVHSPSDSIESTDSIPTDTSSESGLSKPETPVSFNLDTIHLDIGQRSAESLVTVLKKSDETESDVNICDSESDTLTEDNTESQANEIKMRRSLRSCVKKGYDVKNQPNESQSKTEKVEPKASVTFTTEIIETVSLKEDRKEKSYPKDISAVKSKLDTNLYNSVAEFCGDIVRIIRYNIRLPNTSSVHVKAHQSTRSMFLKQMNKCFPWFNAKVNTLWEYERNLPNGMLPDAVLPPYDDHTYAQWMERSEGPQSPQMSPFKRLPSTPRSPITPYKGLSPEIIHYAGEDVRKCSFCGEFGDMPANSCGRLLYANQNEWIHVNCALWSAEVFENSEGTLQNVNTALSRGKHLPCVICEKKGATVGCCARGCHQNFHLLCARQAGSVFQKDKQVFCRLHRSHTNGEVMSVDKLAVDRHVCIDANSNKWSGKSLWRKGVKSSVIHIMVGAMCVEALGHLTPLSDNKHVLLPVDYCVTRVFWSTLDARRRCVYTCRIIEVNPIDSHSPVLKHDLTIVHDPKEPGYDESLHLQYTGEMLKPLNSSTLSEIIDLDAPSENQSFINTSSNSDSSVRKKASSVEYMPKWITQNSTVTNLSASWPSITKTRSSVDLYNEFKVTGTLSPLSSPPPVNRLTQLTRPQSVPLKSETKPHDHGEEENDEFGLLAMVNRLNNAATKNRRRSRGSSTESASRESSCSREGSVERTLCSPPNSGRNTPVILNSPPGFGRITPNAEDTIKRPGSPVRPVVRSRNSHCSNLIAISENSQKAVIVPKTVIGEKQLKVCSNMAASLTNVTTGVMPPPQTTTGYVKRSVNIGESSVVGKSHKVEDISHSSISQGSAKVIYRPRTIKKYVVRRSSSPSFINTSNDDAQKSKIIYKTPLPSNINNQFQTNSSLKDNKQPIKIVYQSPSSATLQEFKQNLKQPDHIMSLSTGPKDSGHKYNSFGDLSVSKYEQNISTGDQEEFTEELIDPQSLVAAGAVITPLSSVKGKDSSSHFVLPQLDGATDDKPPSTSTTELREKLVQKIKAESLARRSPTDQGPVKCYRCKRSYRTVESYKVHIKSCDFVVSSDDEEEEDQNEENVNVTGGDEANATDDERKSYPLRSRRASDIDSSPATQSHKSRTSDVDSSPGLRRRTSSEVGLSIVSQKGRPKRRLSASVEDVPTHLVKRGRGRPCAKPIDDQSDVLPNEKSGRESEIMYQGVKLVKTPFKRGRGRPKKMRPVLVVPPCPREPPHETESDEDIIEEEVENAASHNITEHGDNPINVTEASQSDQQINYSVITTNVSKAINLQPKVVLVDSMEKSKVKQSAKISPTINTKLNPSIHLKRIDAVSTVVTTSKNDASTDQIISGTEQPVLDEGKFVTSAGIKMSSVEEENKTLYRGNVSVTSQSSTLLQLSPEVSGLKSPLIERVHPLQYGSDGVLLSDSKDITSNVDQSAKHVNQSENTVQEQLNNDNSSFCDVQENNDKITEVIHKSLNCIQTSDETKQSSHESDSATESDDCIITDETPPPAKVPIEYVPTTTNKETLDKLSKSLGRNVKMVAAVTKEHYDKLTKSTRCTVMTVSNPILVEAESSVKSPDVKTNSVEQKNQTLNRGHVSKTLQPKLSLRSDNHSILSQDQRICEGTERYKEKSLISIDLQKSNVESVNTMSRIHNYVSSSALVCQPTIVHTTAAIQCQTTISTAKTVLCSTTSPTMWPNRSATNTSSIGTSSKKLISEVVRTGCHGTITATTHKVQKVPKPSPEKQSSVKLSPSILRRKSLSSSNNPTQVTTSVTSYSSAGAQNYHSRGITSEHMSIAKGFGVINASAAAQAPCSVISPKTVISHEANQLHHVNTASNQFVVQATNTTQVSHCTSQQPILTSLVQENKKRMNYVAVKAADGSYHIVQDNNYTSVIGNNMPQQQFTHNQQLLAPVVQQQHQVLAPVQLVQQHQPQIMQQPLQLMPQPLQQAQQLPIYQTNLNVQTSRPYNSGVLSVETRAAGRFEPVIAPKPNIVASKVPMHPVPITVAKTTPSVCITSDSTTMQTDVLPFSAPTNKHVVPQYMRTLSNEDYHKQMLNKRKSLVDKSRTYLVKKRKLNEAVKVQQLSGPIDEVKRHILALKQQIKHQSGKSYQSSMHMKPGYLPQQKFSGRKDQAKENIRIDTSSMNAHPLIHIARRQPYLPEPAVEEEAKEVPLNLISDQKGRHGVGPELKTKKDGPHLKFVIESDDGFKTEADNWNDAWKAVTDKVQDARTNARMKHLPHAGINGAAMLGLTHSAVTFLTEQLFGAHKCRNYNFTYHHYEHDSDDEEPEENSTGSARTEGYTERKPYDMFSFLMSKYRSRPIFNPVNNDSRKGVDMSIKSQRRATSLELPLAMRFRYLREHAKEAVGVYRSGIHGRGLFCKREIDDGEMVIEYAGEIFRCGLTDKREKYYESKGIGCYMFRVDDDHVIDATLRGNAARFINHSCEPNCYSKVIIVDGVKHIVIFALRRIQKGEELTYDYKFPIEDVKIQCTCSAKRCRKYLN